MPFLWKSLKEKAPKWQKLDGNPHLESGTRIVAVDFEQGGFQFQSNDVYENKELMCLAIYFPPMAMATTWE